MRSWDRRGRSALGFRFSALGFRLRLASSFPETVHSVHRETGSRRAKAESREPYLAVAAQQFAELDVDLDGFFGRLIDHFNPAAGVLGRTGLRDQVRGLHDGFEGVAEVVRQKAKVLCEGSGDFIVSARHAGSSYLAWGAALRFIDTREAASRY